MKVNCENCGIEFDITPSRMKKNSSHACSRECRGKLSSIKYSKGVETKCLNCNKTIYYKKSRFKQILNPSCSVECAAKVKSKVYRKNNPRSLNLPEFERIFWDRLKTYKERSKVKGIDFDLDHQFLIDLYNKQKGECFYSGVKLKIKGKKSYDTMSLDRIDSSRGYTKDNVVFCLNCINMLKSNHELSDIENVFRNIIAKKEDFMKSKIKLLYSDSIMPYKEFKENAGYDLYIHSIEDKGTYLKIGTGISLQPELGAYFELVPRSSTYKRGLILYNNLGVIDNNYTGEIFAIFKKTEDFKELPKIGERLVQILPRHYVQVEFDVVEDFEETKRGSGGFGSSGL